MINSELSYVKLGLFLTMLSLLFGLSLGIGFGVAEDNFQTYISQGVDSTPAVHDEKSKDKIWRYAQRAHFHAMGIAAISFVLILLAMHSSLSITLTKFVAFCIGLSGFYPLSWFSMFLLSPTIGRTAAHHHIITELLTYTGVGGLLLGIFILSCNLFFNLFERN